MKFPKYSILYFNHPLTQHQKELGQFLEEGKKVFWFGTESDVTNLKKAKYNRHFIASAGIAAGRSVHWAGR